MRIIWQAYELNGWSGGPEQEPGFPISGMLQATATASRRSALRIRGGEYWRRVRASFLLPEEEFALVPDILVLDITPLAPWGVHLCRNHKDN